MPEKFDQSLDEDLAKIVSYVTFDGHLGKDLNRFYLSSGDWKVLKDFENIVTRKFGLIPRYEKGTGFGFSYKCRFYNSKVARFLFSVGAPKGDKMLTPFSIPNWIKEDSRFSKVYLTTAFQCEGWIHKNSHFESYIVALHMNKSEELLSDGMLFAKELKSLLKIFGVATTNLWIRPANLRKDGRRTKAITFALCTKSLPAFHEKLGFGLSSKKNAMLAKASVVMSRPVLARQNSLCLFDDASSMDEREALVFPESGDADLARLFGYLVKYGGITRDSRQFYIISSKEIILDFARIVYEKFKLRIPYARKKTNASYQCIGCSLAIGKWLKSQGLLSGKKRLLHSKLPSWLVSNPSNYREFLKIIG